MTHYVIKEARRIDSEWYDINTVVTHDLDVARQALAEEVKEFQKDYSSFRTRFSTPDSFRADSACGRFSIYFAVDSVCEVDQADLPQEK